MIPFSSASSKQFVFLRDGLLCVCTCAAWSCPAAEWRTEFEWSVEHDDNPAMASRGEGVPAEFVQELSLSMIRSVAIDERSGWVSRGLLAFRRHSRYSGLDELLGQARLAFRIQPEVGYTAPWYETVASLERSQHSGSPIRDLTRMTLGAAMGAHFTDRLSGQAGIRWTRSVADHAQVFDQTDRTLVADLSYRTGLSSQIYAKYQYAKGDRVLGSTDEYSGARWIKAEADDTALGADMYAYRTEATTKGSEVGASFPTGQQSRLDLGLSTYRSTTDAGQIYQKTMVRAGWRYLLP